MTSPTGPAIDDPQARTRIAQPTTGEHHDATTVGADPGCDLPATLRNGNRAGRRHRNDKHWVFRAVAAGPDNTSHARHFRKSGRRPQ